MTMANKEFYYDDLVILTDDNFKKCSVGLVTKEKPFIPTFLKKLDTKFETNDNVKELQKSDKESDEENVNSSSDDDYGSSSDGNLYDPPQKETVNVSWFIHKHLSKITDVYDNTFIEGLPGKNLHLYDRNLEMSDIVKLNVDGKTKVGTIFNLKMKADVCILGQNKIIKNVDCSRMKWIEPYMGKNLETNYTYDNWLGEILETSLEVIIRFADGARLRVSDSLLNQFDNKIDSIWNPENILEGCVMEGDAQELKSRKTKFLSETAKHNSKWLMKLKQEEIIQVLVEKIIPVNADMQWVFGYNNKTGVVPETPLHTLKGKELEKLEPVHPFPWHCLNVGDIWYYQLAEDDKILQINSEESIDSVIYKLIYGEINSCTEYLPSQSENFDEEKIVTKIVDNQVNNGFVVKPRKKILCNLKSRPKRKPVSLINMKNSCSSDETTDSDVHEQDAEMECKLNISKENFLERSDSLNILTKEAMTRIIPKNLVAVGILLTRCTVDVNWQDGTVNYNIPTTKLVPQMYNIDEHEFFPGDFVIQKFDPLNPNPDQEMHNFGTIITANSKDRVAKVQWFDYIPNDEPAASSIIKSGEAEEIGVYDILALNEHHFVLGQEVIVKQEVAHKNYPAGYVTRLEPNDGLLVIRWPDGEEIPMSPTDLLLTVESAIGRGSESSDEVGSDFSGDESSELRSDSDSDSSAWETVEEIETNQSDESHLSKLISARNYLLELLEKIKKVKIILNSVSEFTQVLQSNLPIHMSQMLSVKDIFKIELENQKSIDNNPDISLFDQQMTIKTLYEIRQDIRTIYKLCNDVSIKRMFECYRPRDFLSFRNIKNFIVSNVQFKQPSIIEDENANLFDSINISQTKQEPTDGLICNSETNSEKNPQEIVAKYLKTQYTNIRSHLQYLQESIEVWLQEKSCYFGDCKIANGDSTDIVENLSPEVPRLSLNDERHLNEQISDIIVANQPESDQIIQLKSDLNCEKPIQNVVEDSKPELYHADSSDKTMSTCEPIPDEQRGQFIIIESAPASHKFINSPKPSFGNPKFSKAWKRDINLLSTSLPRGVIVKSFDDRIDLFSVMIVGPSGTPYQHALFFFDIQLGAQYPTEPPSVFYISLTSERVNPNLYSEGRVCLSLLGTWNGKGTENWDIKVSSLLQLIVSLQGLILVSEPYYNEAGFEIRKGCEEGKENSQRYNENAINNISQSMINLLHKPIPVFENEVNEHFKEFGNRLVEIHNYWSTLDEENMKSNSKLALPDFPLAPVSKGFQLSIQRNINSLRKILAEKASYWQKPKLEN